MNAGVAAIVMAVAFALTTGLHDSATAVAVLVTTRVSPPPPALAFAGVCSLLGSFLPTTAVAVAIAASINVTGTAAIVTIGAALTASVVWNLGAWHLGLPTSATHALGGALVGASLVVGGTDAVNWGGLDGIRPTGVLGLLTALALSPLIGFVVGAGLGKVTRWSLARASVRVGGPVRGTQWGMSGILSFAQCANDAQKAMGLMAAVLVAMGRSTELDITVTVRVVAGGALTVGALLGGWRIARTIGRGITRLTQLDGADAVTSGATVVLGSSLAGAPVSATQVLSSAVAGVGAGRRWRHVRWDVVRNIGLAWVVTLPACAVLGAVLVPLWRLLP